jgi:hypothetical protein
MRVLVCGDRAWKDKAAIRRELEKLPPNTVIVHGACQGADQLAGEVAREPVFRELGFVVEEYPADWARHGRAAGPLRNKKMLATGVDKVLAFHSNLEHSKGTKHMVQIARDAQVLVEIKES